MAHHLVYLSTHPTNVDTCSVVVILAYSV